MKATLTYEKDLLELLASKNPQALELAEAVSFAVLIEPQLLRRARRDLLFGVDAGAEADVWLSALVQTRGPDGIVFEPGVAQALRHRLRNRPNLRFEKAWTVVQAHHLYLSPTLKVEEEINYLATDPDDEALGRINKLLAQVAFSLKTDPARKGLANWAARALPRMSAQVRGLESARLLAAAAYVRIGRYLPLPEGSEESSLPEWMSWVLPKDFPERRIQVRFVKSGLELSTVLKDGPSIAVPATDPSLVEVSWEEDGKRETRRVALRRGEWHVVRLNATQVVVRTILGERFQLEQQRPDQTAGAFEDKKDSQTLQKKKCYVAMGFGIKTDYTKPKAFDLDKTYEHIIKPAALAAGFECVRADEIEHDGRINMPRYEELLKAEVVVADVSTYNVNAFYELGVRHALRPHTTIVICEDGLTFPFDPGQIRVRKYHHLGVGIDFDEVERMRAELTAAMIASENEKDGTDSPVYAFIRDLKPPTIPGTEASTPVSRKPSQDLELKASQDASGIRLLEQADRALASSDFLEAKALLREANRVMPSEPTVLRKLARATYKAGVPDRMRALEEARSIVLMLHPKSTADPETLDLWAAIHKDIWEVTADGGDLDVAIQAYEKRFCIAPNSGAGLQLAYLYTTRSLRRNDIEGIADSVLAKRTWRLAIKLTDGLLLGNTGLEQYWLVAGMAEAWLGVGDKSKSEHYASLASSMRQAEWMNDFTKKRLSQLQLLLEGAPKV